MFATMQFVEWAKMNMVLVGIIFVVVVLISLPFRDPKKKR